jgi:hypothetical protein
MQVFNSLENVSCGSMLNAAGAYMQKELKENATAALVTSLALTVLGAITAKEYFFNAPPKLDDSVCEEFGLPLGSRGTFTRLEHGYNLILKEFSLLEMGWFTAKEKTMFGIQY